MLHLLIVALPLVVALPAAFDEQGANAFEVQSTLQFEVRSPPESRPLPQPRDAARDGVGLDLARGARARRVGKMFIPSAGVPTATEPSACACSSPRLPLSVPVPLPALTARVTQPQREQCFIMASALHPSASASPSSSLHAPHTTHVTACHARSPACPLQLRYVLRARAQPSPYHHVAFFIAPKFATRTSSDQVDRERNALAERVTNTSVLPNTSLLDAMNPDVSSGPNLLTTEPDSPYVAYNSTVTMPYQGDDSLALADKLSYRYIDLDIELDTGMKDGSNPSATMVVASVDVLTGSYLDPKEDSVFAHLYEHNALPLECHVAREGRVRDLPHLGVRRLERLHGQDPHRPLLQQLC